MRLARARWPWRGAAAGLLLLASMACGDGGPPLLSETRTPTPPGRASPIATPFPSPSPAPTGAATPTPTPTPSPAPAGNVPVTPVSPFEITVRDAVNVRAAPNTSAPLLGGIYPGERRRVIGEARGQEVEAGRGDLWYALEGGGFVYAPLVEKVGP